MWNHGISGLGSELHLWGILTLLPWKLKQLWSLAWCNDEIKHKEREATKHMILCACASCMWCKLWWVYADYAAVPGQGFQGVDADRCPLWFWQCCLLTFLWGTLCVLVPCVGWGILFAEAPNCFPIWDWSCHWRRHSWLPLGRQKEHWRLLGISTLCLALACNLYDSIQNHQYCIAVVIGIVLLHW